MDDTVSQLRALRDKGRAQPEQQAEIAKQAEDVIYAAYGDLQHGDRDGVLFFDQLAEILSAAHHVLHEDEPGNYVDDPWGEFDSEVDNLVQFHGDGELDNTPMTEEQQMENIFKGEVYTGPD